MINELRKIPELTRVFNGTNWTQATWRKEWITEETTTERKIKPVALKQWLAKGNGVVMKGPVEKDELCEWVFLILSKDDFYVVSKLKSIPEPIVADLLKTEEMAEQALDLILSQWQ